MLFVTIISTAIIGYLWINHEYNRFDEDSGKLKKEYIESQKNMIKNETEKVIDYIQYTRSKTDLRLRRLLKERVYEAHSIAANIYRKYRKFRSKTEIKQLIIDALRPIRFSRGRGYFFVYTMAGVLELYPAKPETEGSNQSNLQDKHGVYVVRREIEVVIKQREGFIVNAWEQVRDKQGTVEKVPSKVSFVMHFQPLNWYIGSKEYREDFDQDIQRELLERIGKIKFGKDGYIFVVDYEGKTLWNEERKNLEGKKVWATDIPGGADIIRKARKAAEKPGGDFVQYTWYRRNSDKPLPKISFVKGVRDWQWLVGAGVYLDEINPVIEEKRVALEKNVRGQVIKIIGLFILIFVVVLFITLFFSRRLRKEFDVFISFFKKSAVNNETIDKKKLFAQEFKILADSANRMAEERQKMEAELQKAHKLESLGLLAGGIAHDFNNLLTGVLGNISLAKAYANSRDEIYKALVQAEKATVKSKQLTQQLLTFASGGAPIKKVHDIADLLKESVTFSLRGSNVKPEFHLADNLRAVEADEGQMNQVLNNLVINAAQAMPSGGIVRVSTANVNPGKNPGLPLSLADRRYVKIAVEDSGTGIPEELLPKIFDPYFTTKPKGSGLGLTSAYSIIANHEGYIDVKSRPGQGTTFTIYIPASDKKIPAAEKEQTGEKTIKGSGRVLVMDDDEVVADVASRQLDRLGYLPEVVFDGTEAIAVYQEALYTDHPFDVVLMDLTIPGGLGGAETIKKLRELDPEVKAIVSSGYSNDPIMANFQQYGFRACIVKPYKMQELSQTLHQVMNR